MGDLTKNLSRYEFSCNCGCGFDTADFVLVNVLQETCDHFSAEEPTYIIITGPNRCSAHNASIPGAGRNSQHIYGRAADFMLKRKSGYIPPDVIYNYLNNKYPDRFGIGIYSNRIHLDTRTNGPARWDER